MPSCGIPFKRVLERPPEEAAMNALKLTQIGNSIGVILPKELLAKLGVGKGDTL